MKKNIYLCIHGHFYQPPRENAWTNEIEPQPSAAPFHDWNERIYQECYKPNTEAIIVDSHDNVVKRVNNFEYFSFNFGPTLLSWIRHKHPKTYEKIIEADRISADKYDGHGNAIAMVYSHLIMPLANRRDKITQIKWGVADFIFNFGREPEGIWLAETACNEETLEVLCDEGIKFVILDPSQAEKVRSLDKDKNNGKWEDVSSGNIDPRNPFVYYPEKNKKKFINIFFYDGPLSKNIAFDDHIFSSEKLLNRLRQVPVDHKNGDKLISVGVDGETFGHHKHYAERSLSYLFSDLIPESEFEITNFGKYLADHEPENEVKIKKGYRGEGTSWSCLHGVGRWKENCGCGRTDDFPSQEWRKVLRESLDWLRDELSALFEKTGSDYFTNVWKARNEYIEILLDPSKAMLEKFYFNNAKRVLTEKEVTTSLELLEMQKFAMLMYTSCGWFFTDISGIETLQILEYTKRAMELSHRITGIDPEPEFLKKLSKAKSNLDKYSDGKDLYEKEIIQKRFAHTQNDF
ncbi:MAG TPA: DUF3536 domain-containing protein [Ignavibacteria bacterium]|nr:DUF3536 domain-containing protein [Ignavibacteria bacterium]HQY51341.1 DUF3536 domain-containing protein [Ignavibacteria bacterium]HRA99720.1 DUF3536 domain-containing protein [Ignavibacteria bacterium]